MTSERKYWPRVTITDVDPQWWDEVMDGTRLFQSKFDTRLSDDQDFTIRSIVHLVVNKERVQVEWSMKDSLHEDRILQIYDLMHSEEESRQNKGRTELDTLIQEYIADSLDTKLD